jgi:hypothetical protein
MERAVKERVFYVKDKHGNFTKPTSPKVGIYLDKLRQEFGIIKRRCYKAAKWSRDQFVASYLGRKRTVYENAKQSLSDRKFNAKDAYINAFQKVEKFNRTSKPDAVPRVVSPRSPRYNVELGRFLKPIEKKIYKSIDKLCGGPTVMKGYNSVDRGRVISSAWQEFEDPVAIGLDAKRFDQHVSVQALEFEFEIYKLYYTGEDRDYLDKLLRLQFNNRCFSNMQDGLIKYTVRGGRMSGDMNTSLGNVLIMCVITHNYFKRVKYRLVNDGDDCVVIFERKYLRKLTKGVTRHYAGYGFDITVEDPVYELEKIVFCQAQPIFDGSRYIMVRDPRSAMSKDIISVKPLVSEKLSRRWAASVALGGLSLTGGLPIWQDFYNSLHRYSDGAKPLVNDPATDQIMNFLGKGMNRCYSRIDQLTRYSFFLAFDISPSEQIAVEQLLIERELNWGGRNDYALEPGLHLPM